MQTNMLLVGSRGKETFFGGEGRNWGAPGYSCDLRKPKNSRNSYPRYQSQPNYLALTLNALTDPNASRFASDLMHIASAFGCLGWLYFIFT